MSPLRTVLTLILAGSAASALAEPITCGSDKPQPDPCSTVLPGSTVRLVRQLSTTPCVEGRNWGTGDHHDSLWTSSGCRAVFEVQPPADGNASARRDDAPQH